METPTVPTTGFLRILISSDELETIEKRAVKLGKTAEMIAADLIRRFAKLDATKPLVLDDSARQHLEKVLGRNFTTTDEFVSYVQRAMSVRVDGITIPIKPNLLEKLKTRCIGMDFDKFLTQTITRSLEEFVGMR